MVERLVDLFTYIISTGSYLGLGFLMVLESMILPVPSEAVMPFAGFLIAQGKMSWLLVILVSTAGSIIGSLLSYYMGLYGGRPLIIKYGKFLLLNEHHLVRTENFFNKFGDKAIFISRFIPVVRHLISIPAGTGKMRLNKFIIYTTLGAGSWNFILAYAGYYFGANWAVVRKYSEVLDIVLIICVILIAIYYFLKKFRKTKTS